jgi:ATP-dependent helicase/nuclease subunit A
MKHNPLPPDHAARALALDVTQSFIVQAPAGSGKTELLTQRFLHLLAVVETPTEVVAITFTRKAAAEMRERINERLLEAKPGEAAHAARARHPALTAQPELLRVVTFDTLFRALTRLAPLAVGVASDAMIDEAPQARYEAAAQKALADNETAPQVHTLLARLDGNYGTAVRLISGLLAKRDQWLQISLTAPDSDAASAEHVKGIVEAECARVLQQLRLGLRETIPAAQIKEWLALSRFACDTLDSGVLIGEKWPQAEAQALNAWRALFELIFTKDFSFRKTINVSGGFPKEATHEKEQWKKLVEQLSHYEATLGPAAQAVMGLPDLELLASETDSLQAIVTVLTHAAAHLQIDLAQSNAADFVSIALAAQSGVMASDGVLREPIARSLRHVLVDEFQDTSITQFAFLEGVARAWNEFGDGQETLFCVGDPMQSIYRFRQAEVELFSRAQREGIAGKSLIPITLSANFRSDAVIVNWVNAHLAPAIAARNAMTRARIDFAPGIAMRETDATANVSVSAFDTVVDEAAHIVKIVQTALTDTEDTVGILASTRGAIAPIIAALRVAGVDFDARETERLADAQWVTDLLSIAYALSEPDDALSWAALLRAPWCGLVLTDLTVVLAAAGATQSVWEASANVAELALSADGRSRVQAWRAQLAPCVAAVGVRPLAEVVEAAWARLDARACTPASSREDFEAVIEAIRVHEKGGRLLDRGAMQLAIARLEPGEAMSARVQVLTIHKAKGLQFDTVILPALGKAGRADDAPLLRWMRFPNGAMIVPQPMSKDDPLTSTYDWLKLLEAHEQNAERARVLYVATTRAKRALHLSATMGFDESGAPKPASRSLFAALPEQTAVEVFRNPDMIDDIPKKVFAPALIRRAHLAQVGSLTEHKPARVPPCEPMASRAARALGVVAHSWMTAHGNRAAWSEAAAQWANEQLDAAIPKKELRADAVWQLQRMIEKINACEHAAFIFDPAHRAWDEIALIAPNVPKASKTAPQVSPLANDDISGPRTLRPDRIFQTQAGQWWVIDYKTSQPNDETGETPEQFFRKEISVYREQLNGYEAALREWKQIPAAQEIICALYFPMSGALVRL